MFRLLWESIDFMLFIFKTRTCVQMAVKDFSEVATETQITSMGPYKRET